VAFWLLYPPEGGDPHQVRTKGGSEPGERDNPNGWRAVKVTRHSHDPRERYDAGARRWKRCPRREAEHEARERTAAEAEAARLPEAVIDAIADRILARLAERGVLAAGTAIEGAQK
jgi:hypothetical protein